MRNFHGCILAEVMLCIGVATRLDAGCRPGDTYCRSCFVLAGEMYFAKEVAVPGAVTAKALALIAHVLVDEDVLLHIVALSDLLFPARFAAALPVFFSPSHSS
jgi:hypothetical protein